MMKFLREVLRGLAVDKGSKRGPKMITRSIRYWFGASLIAALAPASLIEADTASMVTS
jgi:hypothetical protein